MHKSIFKKTIKGATYFTFRTAILFPISLLGIMLLSWFLDPADFGMYAVAMFVVNLIASFSDVGLSATLVQRREDLTTGHLRSVFTAQLFLVGCIFLVIFISSPLLAQHYKFQKPELSWLFPLVALPILFVPIKTVSNALLSRELAFNKIAVIEVMSALIYQMLVVFLAWYGLGVWSFAIANTVSRLYEVIAFYNARRWPLGLSWDKTFLRSAIKFGGIFQLSGMTSVLRDNIIPLLAAPIFGPAVAGYLKWGQNVASQFSQRISRVITQVAFPSFSRLQNEKENLEMMINKILRYTNIISILLLGVLSAIMPEIDKLIFNDKWQPGIFVFYFFAMTMLAGNFTTLLDIFIKASGHVNLSLKIMTVWTAVNWLLAVVSIQFFDFAGVAIGYALGSWVAAIWLIYAVQSLGIKINLAHVFYRPLLSGFVMVILLLKIKSLFPVILLSLFILTCMGTSIYLIAIFALERKSFVTELYKDFIFLKKSALFPDK